MGSASSLMELGCHSFEVAKVEPLHDFKTFIVNVPREIPLHYPADGLMKESLHSYARNISGATSFALLTFHQYLLLVKLISWP